MAASDNPRYAAGLLAELADALKREGACSLIAHKRNRSLLECEFGK
jgi:hypothetical protein